MGRWAQQHRSGERELSLGVRQHMVVQGVTAQIEALMKRGKVKRTDLAQRLKVSRAWVSKLLVDAGRNVTLFTLVQVADALGADLEVKLVPKESSALQSEPVRPSSRTFVVFDSSIWAIGASAVGDAPQREWMFHHDVVAGSALGTLSWQIEGSEVVQLKDLDVVEPEASSA